MKFSINEQVGDLTNKCEHKNSSEGKISTSTTIKPFPTKWGEGITERYLKEEKEKIKRSIK